MRYGLTLLLAAVLLAGCGTREESFPVYPPSPAGAWRGSATDSAAGAGTLAVSVVAYSNVNGSLSGAWTVDFAGTVDDESGSFSGRIYPDGSFALVLLDGAGCHWYLSGRYAPETWSGSYSRDCAPFNTGSFSLART